MSERESSPESESQRTTFEHNREVWNRWVEQGIRWSVPVTEDQVAAARRGQVEIILTPTRPVPSEWLADLCGQRILCLAGAGGQQAPVLAAAGASVTVFDASPRQLEQDRAVAAREGLDLRLVEGDMADLSVFEDGEFDRIVHPASNCFVPDVLPVWREAFRVLVPGGELLSGFANPLVYLFDDRQYDPGADLEVLEARRRIPFSPLEQLSQLELRQLEAAGEAHEFGHSLEQQIGGQLAAGFVLVGFYEDVFPDSLLSRLTPTYLATRVRKPAA